LLSTEFPGTYTVTNLDYTFSKNSEGGGMQSLSVNINNFATQSGSNWQVSFPSSVTSDMDITVNIPSGLSIITVEGGEKTSDTSAVSTGGDFKVTYGKPGQDYTLWIIAAVIVIVLFALFRRKGKK
jgi:hypothetical protein